MERKEHWENIYTTKETTDVGWYQADPKVSMELILSASPDRGGVVDVGGGASLLVDRLLEAGVAKVAVLDISTAALQRAKSRLGDRAARVQWIVGDVTAMASVGSFDVWHDRAVFHFLADPDERRKYVELMTRTIPPGGHLVIGTFALDGPPRCSGLAVCRYDADMLGREFGSAFQLMKELPQTHITPRGSPQKFIFGLFRRM
ncbi:MAG TPA: class I SAM-dependent methyltransferase [Tepidisphaeraceae bacterium]|jgi:2-polyprenyl-3-methyl-5-hydroxy-6-metoxy-1,4-benzoquinol methylase